jgi:hypothetical protein
MRQGKCRRLGMRKPRQQAGFAFVKMGEPNAFAVVSLTDTNMIGLWEVRSDVIREQVNPPKCGPRQIAYILINVQ